MICMTPADSLSEFKLLFFNHVNQQSEGVLLSLSSGDSCNKRIYPRHIPEKV